MNIIGNFKQFFWDDVIFLLPFYLCGHIYDFTVLTIWQSKMPRLKIIVEELATLIPDLFQSYTILCQVCYSIICYYAFELYILGLTYWKSFIQCSSMCMCLSIYTYMF